MTTSQYPLPKLIAHRGASAYAPENTLASFKKAYEMGARWLEFDVMLTRDDIPIIFHDQTTTRTTDQPNLNIAELTLKEIKKLDAGSWFSEDFLGETIPTLEETLIWMQEHHMLANIEIKPTLHREVETAIRTIEVLKKQWYSSTLPLISSFHVESLHAARQHHPTIALGLLKDTWNMCDLPLLQSLPCLSVHLYYKHLTDPAIVSTIKALGFGVLCYTVDEPKLAKQFFEWGVDGIFSNHPDLLS